MLYSFAQRCHKPVIWMAFQIGIRKRETFWMAFWMGLWVKNFFVIFSIPIKGKEHHHFIVSF